MGAGEQGGGGARHLRPYTDGARLRRQAGLEERSQVHRTHPVVQTAGEQTCVGWVSPGVVWWPRLREGGQER